MLSGVRLLLLVGGVLGHRYPPGPGAYPPLHPHYPPGGPGGPGMPLRSPGPPSMFPMRDQSHEHPSLLPPPPEPGTAGGQPLPPLPPPPPPPGVGNNPNRPSLPHRPPHWPAMQGYQRPMDDMVDITNELGVAVLQDYAYSRGNFAFSPYGVASVLVVLYEGARGETARQVHTTLKLPWDRDAMRVGFRDVHRNLRSYFSHEGYLSGVTLSQSRTALLPEFRRVLRFYGYDVDMPANANVNASDPTVTITSPQISSSNKPAGAAGNGTAADVTSAPSPAPAPSSTTPAHQTTTTMTAPSSSAANKETTTTPAVSTTSAAPARTEAPPPSTEPPSTSVAPPSTSAPSSSTPAATTPSPTTPDSTPTSTSPSSEEATTTTAAAASPLTPATAENEVEAEAERIDVTGTPSLSLLNPSLLQQQKFPGILMGSRLQEQLNALFPEGLPEAAPETAPETAPEAAPESRGDDVDLLPTSTSTAPTSQPSEAEVLEAEPEVEAAAQADVEASDPEPVAATPGTTVVPEEWPTLPWTTEQPVVDDSSTVVDVTTEALSLETTTTESRSDLTSATEELPPEASDPEPEPLNDSTTAAVADDATTPTPTSTPAPTPDSAGVRRRARLPGPALSFWTGLEAASALNDSKTTHRRRREVNGGFPDLSLQLQNGMFDSHVATGDELFTQLPRRQFLVDGAFEEPVPVMEYTASFPFAYIPRLHALALEFPLDDERYRLLLLLPVERQGLRQLLHALNRVPLREVQRALRPTRVQAVVPAFMVEGFVILTPTLQQLGIWDLFDPRRADLSGMTDDPDLYVRNIEQAVTVVVKNYVEILDIQTRTTAARARLDQFIATHPFLYFVMDSETQVSLMAGKVVDPLNSRIY